MSNVLRQSQRVNLRESSRNSTNAIGSSGPLQYCVDLSPTSDEVLRKELESHIIMKKDAKVAIGQSILKYQTQIGVQNSCA